MTAPDGPPRFDIFAMSCWLFPKTTAWVISIVERVKGWDICQAYLGDR